MTAQGRGVGGPEPAGEPVPDRARPARTDFSAFAELYARARPTYPTALFDWLAGLPEGRGLAWDCATGNGQAARGLAPHFSRVVATDASVEQVSHAASHPRIEYRVAAAEESGLDPASVDLVTVAAAVHWFDLDRFGAEVERVVRPGGVVAVWTYHVAHLESVAAPVLARFYEGVTKPYFAAGARLVDGKYRDIRLPGHEVDAPDFAMEARWSRDEILAFVLSWSGTQKYVKEAGSGAIEAMAAELDRACASEPGPHAMRWPLYLRVSRL